MNKKTLVVCMAIAAGLFMASSAMAITVGGELSDIAFQITSNLRTAGHNSGNTAGTILNPEGKGDALIFPYYDVREINGKTQDFYFAIVNIEPDRCEGVSTNCDAGMAAKLRFREWDKSQEVFDVDIWLSRGDVWVGVVTHNTSLALPLGARITSPDNVIILPAPPAPLCTSTFTVATPLAGGFDFPSTATIPTGSSNLMGYFEVIGEEMTFDKQSGGVVTRLCNDAENNLMGYAYLVRVVDGSSFAYNAKAIANFSKNQGFLFSGAGSTDPRLSACEDSLDQLEFQLSKEEVYAGYSIEDVIAGKFSLILTFPTKHFHFCTGPNYTIRGGTGAPCSGYPFGTPWTVDTMNTPQSVDVEIWDRNENLLVPQTVFYSPPPTTPTVGLPFEVSIIGLYKGTPPTVPAANIRDNLAFSTGTPGFDSGYIVVEFVNGDSPKAGNKSVLLGGPLTAYQWFGNLFFNYSGLPVLGLSLQEFSNNVAGGFYGDIRDVIYNVDWYTAD